MSTDVLLKSLNKFSDVDDQMYSEMYAKPNLERTVNDRTPEQQEKIDQMYKDLKDNDDKLKADNADKLKAVHADLLEVEKDISKINIQREEVTDKINITKANHNKNNAAIIKIIIILIILLIFSIVLAIKINPGFLAFLVFVPVCLYYANRKRIIYNQLKKDTEDLNIEQKKLDNKFSQLSIRKGLIQLIEY